MNSNSKTKKMLSETKSQDLLVSSNKKKLQRNGFQLKTPFREIALITIKLFLYLALYCGNRFLGFEPWIPGAKQFFGLFVFFSIGGFLGFILLSIFPEVFGVNPAPLRLLLELITEFLYSEKVFKSTFEPIFEEWRYESEKSNKNNQKLRAKWMSIYYTYVFLVAIWQRSPIGDLIEFVRRFIR